MQNPQNITIIFGLISALIGAFTARMWYLSVKLARLNVRLALLSKRVDVLLQVTGRYVEIWDSLDECRAGLSPGEAPLLFRRFWSLQREQFRYSLMGFLEDADYHLWMQYRCQEHRDNQKFGSITYQKAADDSLAFISQPEFTKFMRLVFDGQLDQAFEYKDELIKKNEALALKAEKTGQRKRTFTITV